MHARIAYLTILGLFCFGSTLFSQTVTPSSWVPLTLGAKLNQTPLTLTDAQIKTLIDGYQHDIDDSLDQDLAIVKRILPQLKENVIMLYNEYNLDHNRSAYEAADFTATECLGVLQTDMNFYITRLKRGVSPDFAVRGMYMPKVFWLGYTWNQMCEYTSRAPITYDPAISSPLIISSQDNPTDNLVQETPYILVRSFKKGYQNNDVKEEIKNREIIVDIAKDLNVDPFRIFATGFSKGGQQTLKLGFRYQDWFAGLISVHNDFMVANFPMQWPLLGNLINTPTLLEHGSRDDYYYNNLPRDTMYHFMLASGCPVEQYIDGNGHTADKPFRDSIALLIGFCDKATMNPYPKVVLHTVEHPRYSRAFWTNAKLLVTDGTVYPQYRVEAKDSNIIEITLLQHGERIQGFDFYLSDQLVDMAKPVKIVHGTDTLYNGTAGFRVTVTVNPGTGSDAKIVGLLWQILDNTRKTIFGYTTASEQAATAANDASAGIAVFPNPFNPLTRITAHWQAVGSEKAQITIYSIHGKLVQSIPATSRQLSAGVTWDAAAMPSGTYIVKIAMGNQVKSARLVLMK